jgi:hypothetical protein
MAMQRVGLLASSAKVSEPAARGPLQVPEMPARGPSGGVRRSHVKIGGGGGGRAGGPVGGTRTEGKRDEGSVACSPLGDRSRRARGEAGRVARHRRDPGRGRPSGETAAGPGARQAEWQDE